MISPVRASLFPQNLTQYIPNIYIYIDLTVPFIMWFTIENYVVIIAASIPALRPLAMHVQKVSSNASNTYPLKDNYRAVSGVCATKGYLPYGQGRDGPTTDFESNTVVNGGDDKHKMTEIGESGSEDYALPIQGTQSGIMKTTNVSVKYSKD